MSDDVSYRVEETPYGPSVPDVRWVPSPSYALRRQRILAVLKERPVGRLLEVGCGAGTLLVELDQLGFECVALETSHESARIARMVHKDRTRVEIHERPVSGWLARFDTVLACEVLEHIEDDAGAVCQWAQWLVPGGRLVCSVPAHHRRWSSSDVWAGHYRRYERDELTDLLEGGGFSVDSLEVYGFPIANMIAPIRAWSHRRSLNDQILTVRRSSERSGISRGSEATLFRLQSSCLGRVAMWCGIKCQDWLRNTEIGTGYIAVATLPGQAGL